MADTTLGPLLSNCVETDCGRNFAIPISEQEFLKKQFGDNFALPRRCKDCRRQRKAEKAASGSRG